MLPSDVLLGSLKNIGRHTEASGDGEGVALTGQADLQPVGWSKRLYVKFNGGVAHARGFISEGLQLGVMTRSNGQNAGPTEADR